MTRRETALCFVRAFCAVDIIALEALLTEDLLFNGPLRKFTSRAAYLQCLTADAMVPADHEILNVAESGDAVALFWEYRKPGKPVKIAQLFRYRGELMSDILLIFDTGEADL